MRRANSSPTPPGRSSASGACRSAGASSTATTLPTEARGARMATMNRQFHLVSRPEGEATASNFRLVEAPLPALADGQVLVRHHYLSLDPYMRGRMNDAKSYAEPQKLDTVMQGGIVGEVVESRHADYRQGDKVVGVGGWQEHSIANGA